MLHPCYSDVQMESAFYRPGPVIVRMTVEITQMNGKKYVSHSLLHAACNSNSFHPLNSSTSTTMLGPFEQAFKEDFENSL